MEVEGGKKAQNLENGATVRKGGPRTSRQGVETVVDGWRMQSQEATGAGQGVWAHRAGPGVVRAGTVPGERVPT